MDSCQQKGCDCRITFVGEITGSKACFIEDYTDRLDCRNFASLGIDPVQACARNATHS